MAREFSENRTDRSFAAGACGFAAVGAVLRQLGQIHLDDVFGVVIDGIPEFDGAVADFADAVMTVDEAGLGERIATDGARGDLFGGGQVLLHQGGGDGEDVADVVEAVAGIVGGELFGGAEIDAEQVADGVGIFVAIEAMGDGAAGVGLLVVIGLYRVRSGRRR